MAPIRLDQLSKQFPDGHAAVCELSLALADGELLVLVGPSGCGKSTTLRMVAGLETPTSGRVYLGARDVTALPPQERDVAMVFQTYALYPHKTVRQNLEFPLRMRGVDRALARERVETTAAGLGLERLLERKPRQLSGGQRQRVALGRAIVRQPQAFLLDEPLSNLDPQLRVHTRAELMRLHRRLGATMLYVTHDQEEALTLGDRVAVLRAGTLQQAATPDEIYRRPANKFVAGFIGSPSMNFFEVRPEVADGRLRLRHQLFRVDAPSKPPSSAGDTVWLGVRPGDLALSPPGTGDLDARVDVVESLGHAVIVHLVAAAAGGTFRFTALAPPDAGLIADSVVGVRIGRERLHLFDRATERRLP